MRRFFTRYDVLIAPVSPTAAFPHGHRPIQRRTLKCSDGHEIAYIEMLKWIALGDSHRGECQGLPVGIQIIGPRSGDVLTTSRLRRPLTSSLVAFVLHLSNRKRAALVLLQDAVLHSLNKL
jgi:hypothetical protein